MKLLLQFVVVATVLAVRPPAHAQTSGTAPTPRALARLVERLRADATLPDSLRRLTAADLMGTVNMRYVALLDDTSSGLLMRTTAATLHQVPDSVCGALLEAAGGAPSDLAMLQFVDSGTTADWAIILERIVRARASALPGPRVASDTEVRAIMLGLQGRFSTADRERMVRMAQQPPPSGSDFCWSTRLVIDGIAALPPAELGPLVRKMFGGGPGSK